MHAESEDLSLPPSLAFSPEYITRSSDVWTVDATARAVLVWDDNSEAGSVIVEHGSGEVDDRGRGGKNDTKYWVILVRPQQICRILGRCRFWVCY